MVCQRQNARADHRGGKYSLIFDIMYEAEHVLSTPVYTQMRLCMSHRCMYATSYGEYGQCSHEMDMKAKRHAARQQQQQQQQQGGGSRGGGGGQQRHPTGPHQPDAKRPRCDSGMLGSGPASGRPQLRERPAPASSRTSLA